MLLSNRIKLFFLSALFLCYLLRVPGLIDEFLPARFALVSLLCLLAFLFIIPRLKIVDFTLFDGILFLYFLFHLISISYALNFAEAVFSTQSALLFCTSFYLFRLMLLEEAAVLPFLSKIILWLSAFCIFITIYQLVSTSMVEGLSGKGIYQVIGHSGHKNSFSTVLFLLIGFNAYFIIGRKDKIAQLLAISILIILVLLLRSRAVFLALSIFTLIAVSYYSIYKFKIRQQHINRLGIGIIVTFLFMASMIHFTEMGRDYRKLFKPATYASSASGAERLFVWVKTTMLIQDKPLSGYGAGNWKIFLPSKGIQGAYRLQEKGFVFTRVHNDYLEVAAELGIPALLVYLTIFGLAFRMIGKRFSRANSTEKHQLLILSASLTGYLVIAFFDFPKERIELQVLLAFLLALIAWHFVKTGKSGVLLIGKKRQLLTISFIVLLLLQLPTAYYRLKAGYFSFKLQTAKVNQQWELVSQYAKEAASPFYSIDESALPLAWYQGLSKYMTADYSAALPLFAKGYAQTPYNHHILNNYASTLVQLGDFQESVALYETALRINPKFEDAMFNLAYSYYRLNEMDKALEWVEKTKNNPEKKAQFMERIRQVSVQEIK